MLKSLFGIGLVLGLVILFLAFFYFGYRDDFRRNKKEFVGTVIGVIIFGIVCYFSISNSPLEILVAIIGLQLISNFK